MWSQCDIVLIPKAYKKDFRPIILASCVLKLLEKLIKPRLERYVEMDYLLRNSQYGFRKERSCNDCLAVINLNVYKAFSGRSYVGGLFVDIKSAYDNVDPKRLFDLIDTFKIPIGYKWFVRNLISPRNANFFKSGLFFSSRCLRKGLPQGVVSSPLLFNLYVKDILYYIPHNCQTIQFADDIAILCQDPKAEHITQSLSLAFMRLNDWLSSINLEISIPKTQFIIFNRTKSQLPPNGLQVGDDYIPSKNSIKYLGIILDASLRWLPHIKNLREKTAIFTNILKWLCGKNWGISPAEGINFINATIMAQLEWGAM